MTTLNWGLLSTARINRKLIPPLRGSARNRLVAVASRDLARAQAYAAENAIGRVHGSYEALLADPEVHVIYNPLPNHLHAEWTIKALRAGKHVLCEKPLALSLAEVDAMAAAAAETGRVVQEAFMYRHHPQTLKARALITEGVLGDLQFLRGTFSFPLADRDSDVRWVQAYGGGSIWDVGSYPISYMRTMVGAEPIEVSGQMVRSHSNVDLAFTGLLRFPGDVLAQFDSAFRSPHLRTAIEIVGSQASLRIASPFVLEGDGELVLQRGGAQEILVVPGGSLYAFQVENMAAAILDGAAPRISLADSRANTAAILALLRSTETGAPAQV
jgi:predicted dehydrogenase